MSANDPKQTGKVADINGMINDNKKHKKVIGPLVIQLFMYLVVMLFSFLAHGGHAWSTAEVEEPESYIWSFSLYGMMCHQTKDGKEKEIFDGEYGNPETEPIINEPDSAGFNIFATLGTGVVALGAAIFNAFSIYKIIKGGKRKRKVEKGVVCTVMLFAILEIIAASLWSMEAEDHFFKDVEDDRMDDGMEFTACAAHCGLSVASGVFGLLTGIFGAITAGLVAKCDSCYTGEPEDDGPSTVSVKPAEPAAPPSESEC